MSESGIKWKKPTTWMVLGFIALFFFMLSKEARAETSMEFAPTIFVAGNRYSSVALFLEERFANKYAFGVGLTTNWSCVDYCKRGEGPTNQVFYIQRIVHYKKLELGIGGSYWHNKTPAWDSHTPFALSIAWHFSDHLSIKERHFSTAGSSDRNGGLDMITIVWRF